MKIPKFSCSRLYGSSSFSPGEERPAFLHHVNEKAS